MYNRIDSKMEEDAEDHDMDLEASNSGHEDLSEESDDQNHMTNMVIKMFLKKVGL